MMIRFLFLTCFLLSSAPVAAQVPDSVFTVILEGGTVYDGQGGDPVVTDVGLLGNRIAAIGDLSDRRASLRLDVHGLAVVPGFIDIHSHAARTTPEASGLFRHPLAENYIRQGVTTAIGGQDGSSAYPVGDFLARLEATPPAINFGMFVGHGTIRGRVMGLVNRKPTDPELERMQGMVAAAMQDGAFGLSSGLEYTPGTFATTEELVALAQAMAPYGGVYISHIRDEGGKLLESVAEVIRVGEEGGVPAQVTHHKVIGPSRWGNAEASLRLVDEARARGVDVTSDQYPYTASSTGLTILFPGWSKEGGQQALVERLQDAPTRARIHHAIVEHINAERGGDPATIVTANCSWNAALNGKSLADILAEQHRPVHVEEAAQLAMELQEKGGCQGVFHSMSEEDVRRIMQHPWTMIASDGGIPTPDRGVPHPRNYGTFARVLGHYVRQQGILSFSEAVRKMTRLPAQRLGLSDRGELRVGAMADVAVLDAGVVVDRATFGAPHQYAEGVVHVFVNGQAVLLDGRLTGTRPGRVLRSTK
ncbi:MAG: amidohydrolase family protein [Rhodothermales bacterium]